MKVSGKDRKFSNTYQLVMPLENFDDSYRRPLSKRINLGDGYYLVDFDKKMIGDGLDFFGRTSSEWAREKIENTRKAIIKTYNTKDNDPNSWKEIEEKDSMQHFASWIAASLRLIKPSDFIPHTYHVRISGSKKEAVLASVSTNSTFIHGHKRSEGVFNRLDQAAIRRNSHFILEQSKKYKGKFNRILNSLDLYSEACRQVRYDTTLILMISAIEALYTYKDTGISEQLAQNSALYLFRRESARLKQYENMKEAYNVRSRLLHGDKLKKLYYDDPTKQELIQKHAYDTYAQTLNKIIQSEHSSFFDERRKLKHMIQSLQYGSSTIAR